MHVEDGARPEPRTAFERLEADWLALLTAFGERVVDEHRGRPVGSTYARLRSAFGVRLRAIEIESLSEEEQAGFATIASALTFYDGLVAGSDPPPDESSRAAEGAATLADLRADTIGAYAAAAADIRVDGERLDRLTALGRLATVEDPRQRRDIFMAMEPTFQAIAGDGGPNAPYRRLVRASARTWEREGSVIDANAEALGIPAGDFEPMLRAILEAGRRRLADLSGDKPIEPWDYRFVVGEAERRLASALPRDRLRAINDAHLADLGADPDDLGITYDVEPRAGRPEIPVAFTIGVGSPSRPWVFATYRDGGLGNLTELLHESGHALHYAAIRTRPCFAEPAADFAAFFEAVADVVGWDAGEPAFQEAYLGTSVDRATARMDRYGGVLLDVCWALFEIELHRTPDVDPNAVWTEITRDGLGIAAHRDLAWWAVRGQLVDAPGYLADYAMSAIAAAAIRARLRAVRGDWSAGDAGWYPYLADRLLRYGGSRRPAELIRDLLGGPLTIAPLLEDLDAPV